MANAYQLVEFSDIKFEKKAIGRGTFGTVYEAKWQGKVIAVKDFHLDSENNREELEKELTQSFRIGKHPNIIDIFGVSVNNVQTYLLMEYAYGGSLQQFLFGSKKVEYTTERAISWMYQCAQGVAFLHGMQPKPLLHRDLKPANLLLTDSNCETLKICDFGTVRELKTIMTENKGTWSYMAPEVYNNRKYTEKCDVYSFAIILWEVFTREEYFRTFNSHWAILIRVVQGHRPEIKDVIPDRIRTLMISCWKENPSERPYMMDVVVQMKSILKIYGINDPTDNFLGLRVCDVMEEIGLAVASDRDEGNEIIPSSSTSQDYPFKIKVPPEIRMACPIGEIKEILVLEQLTSLNNIKKQAFEKGWFGTTYKAQAQVNGKTKMLALKVYNRKYSNMDDKLLKFYSSGSPDALEFYFTFSHELKIYYVLDCLELSSLYRILHLVGGWEWVCFYTANWFHELALALIHFHEKDICVNMLTSRNLFIDGFRNLKIGLPVAEEEANFFKTTYRSAAWMAPEVHENGKYSMKSDIYSLGIIIWEVRNRKIPFEGYTPDKIAEMVKKGKRPPIKEDEDESIKKLLRSCWERDPESRPTTDIVKDTIHFMTYELDLF